MYPALPIFPKTLQEASISRLSGREFRHNRKAPGYVAGTAN
jgi:hypothetical protein